MTVKSSFCQFYNLWQNKLNTVEYENCYEEHKEECTENHSGSTEKMEIDAIFEKCLRDLKKSMEQNMECILATLVITKLSKLCKTQKLILTSL